MANKKLENQELRHKNDELAETIAGLEAKNRGLLEMHVKDQHEIADLKKIQQDAIIEVDQIYRIYLQAITEQYGSPVEDEGKVIGKRLTFIDKPPASRFEMSAREKDDDTREITMGVIYDEEEVS